MQLDVEQRGDYTVLLVRGELDAVSRRRVVSEVDRVAEEGAQRLVLNLSGVRFIDSTGLDTILQLSRALAAKGVRIAVSSPSGFCRQVMERIGLGRVVPILDSDSQAGASLAEGSAPSAC